MDSTARWLPVQLILQVSLFLYAAFHQHTVPRFLPVMQMSAAALQYASKVLCLVLQAVPKTSNGACAMTCVGLRVCCWLMGAASSFLMFSGVQH
jgi:hypothetical protein